MDTVVARFRFVFVQPLVDFWNFFIKVHACLIAMASDGK